MSNAKVVIHPEDEIGVISPRVYGHFAEHLGRCCYDGLWTGDKSYNVEKDNGWRADAVQAFKEMPVPLLRWPGGCYADHYHWRDGIGNPASRPQRLGMSCGETTLDTNSIGTDEFLYLCEKIGADAYLAGNMGSGTPQEMCDWLEYCNTKIETTIAKERIANGRNEPWNVPFWGVGNENWGCGGNFTAKQYGLEYKRFATMLRHVDPSAQLVTCGWDVMEWNKELIETLKSHMDLVDHYSIHRYWSAGSAVNFSEDDYYNMIVESEKTEHLILTVGKMLADATDGKRFVGVALDEWGVWSPEANLDANYYMETTMRDAIAAAITFEGFHRQCKVLSMANIAQISNVLQASIQTSGESMWKTPTYYAFKMYAPHQGATAVVCTIDDAHFRLPNRQTGLSATASKATNGATTVSVVNRHMDKDVTVDISGCGGSTCNAVLLSSEAPNSVNSAAEPDKVTLKPVDLNTSVDGTWTVTLPAHSICSITIS